MNNIKKLFMLFLFTFSSLFAQTKPYEISAVVGYNAIQKNSQIKNFPLFGIGFTFHDLLLEDLKPEFNIYTSSIKYDNDESSMLYRYTFNLIYDLPTHKYYLPYIKGGVGYETLESKQLNNTNGMLLNGGAGVKLLFNPAWSLKAEALYTFKDNSTQWQSNFGVFLGVSYAFGGEKEPRYEVLENIIEQPKEVVKEEKENENLFKDSDEDGVLDSKDKCPNTPKGVKIDAFGCEIDSDGDGVSDSKDRCPNTPKGVKVDKEGCPLDKDGDGVLNVIDKCPNTPKGVIVDKDGCKIKEIIALIPGNKKKSAIVVSTKGGEVVIDKPNTLTTISNPLAAPAAPQEVTQETLKSFFSPAIVSTANEFKPKRYVLYFSNGLTIDPSSQESYKSLLQDVKQREGEFIKIFGYTDSVGSKNFNIQFGQKRADFIKNKILQVSPDSKIETKSYGEAMLQVPTPDNTPELKNRRVEVFVY